MILPTVTIKAANARGFRIINESDFDPTIHEVYGEPARITPEDIDAMTKAGVREILDAHSAEYDARASVAQLREIAKRVMFVNLDGEPDDDRR